MLKTIIDKWEGQVQVNDDIMSAEEARSRIDFKTLQDVKSICLYSKYSDVLKTQSDAIQSNPIEDVESDDEITITVKQYMTMKSTPSFDFMANWNHDVPMPLRTMKGIIVKETKGMYYMKLHGFGKPTINCMICGRELTNPISRHYGIGPICLGRVGIGRAIEDISGIKEELANITWEGWVIKSAIVEQS